MTSAARKATFTVLVFFLVLVLFVLTVQLGHVARLVPLKVVIPALVLVLFQLLLDLMPGLARRFAPFEQVDLPARKDIRDSGSANLDTRVVSQKETLAIFWIFLVLVLTYLLGFLIGLPLYLFLYLKIPARESWRVSVSTSIVLGGLLFIVFRLGLDTSLYQGLVPPLAWELIG